MFISSFKLRLGKYSRLSEQCKSFFTENKKPVFKRKKKKLAQRKAKKMRIRNTDYWTGQIQADNVFPERTRLPKNAQEEQNYLIPPYYARRTAMYG